MWVLILVFIYIIAGKIGKLFDDYFDGKLK